MASCKEYCKECIHNDICDLQKIIIENRDSCKHFKDSNRFVELPSEVEKVDLAHTYQIPMETILSENDIQEIIFDNFSQYITEKIRPNIHTTEDTSRKTGEERFLRNIRVFRSYLTLYIEKNSDFNANINTPMKIGIWNGQYSCPNCLRPFGNSKDILMRYKVILYRCPDCGQALDWGDED